MVLYLHAKFRDDRSNSLGTKASLPVLVVTSGLGISLPAAYDPLNVSLGSDEVLRGMLPLSLRSLLSVF